MLVEVEITDFAIVRAARLTLTGGLCVLTGETGAGKSLVSDAIAALLGERTGPEVIRSGADSARLRAVFDLTDCPTAVATLTELGLPPEELCLVTREIVAAGRSRCTINGRAATVSMLRRLGERLIDLHGQHEHQSLLRVGAHLGLLDATGGPALAAARERYAAAWRAWREVVETLDRLRGDERERARRVERLRFEVDEIAAARLRPGEAEELLAERSRLVHAERLLELAAGAWGALAEGEEAPAAIDRVAAALTAVRDMADYDAELTPLADDLTAALASLTEAARALAGYAERVEADPRRLDEIETRRELIARLERKYGEGIPAILAYADSAASELSELETADERLTELIAAEARLAGELLAAARDLSGLRASAAEALREGIVTELAELGLAGADFRVALTPRPGDGTAGLTADGAESAEFLFSANPGEPPRPLARIASGGEISRVMLALKSRLAATDDIPTLIFDEIDVGLGGVTIHGVGRKMARLARSRQIICITHHAPIAARADAHLTVEKAADGAATDVVVRLLEPAERVRELARMLGRQPPTEATLALARELLEEVAAEG